MCNQNVNFLKWICYLVLRAMAVCSCPIQSMVIFCFHSYLMGFSSSLLYWCFPWQKAVFPSPEDTLISFLPLAHMFERVVEVGTCVFYVVIKKPCLFAEWLCSDSQRHTHFLFASCTYVWKNSPGKFVLSGQQFWSTNLPAASEPPPHL